MMVCLCTSEKRYHAHSCTYSEHIKNILTAKVAESTDIMAVEERAEIEEFQDDVSYLLYIFVDFKYDLFILCFKSYFNNNDINWY